MYIHLYIYIYIYIQGFISHYVDKTLAVMFFHSETT